MDLGKWAGYYRQGHRCFIAEAGMKLFVVLSEDRSKGYRNPKTRCLILPRRLGSVTTQKSMRRRERVRVCLRERRPHIALRACVLMG